MAHHRNDQGECHPSPSFGDSSAGSVHQEGACLPRSIRWLPRAAQAHQGVHHVVPSIRRRHPRSAGWHRAGAAERRGPHPGVKSPEPLGVDASPEAAPCRSVILPVLQSRARTFRGRRNNGDRRSGLPFRAGLMLAVLSQVLTLLVSGQAIQRCTPSGEMEAHAEIAFLCPSLRLPAVKGASPESSLVASRCSHDQFDVFSRRDERGGDLNPGPSISAPPCAAIALDAAPARHATARLVSPSSALRQSVIPLRL